MATRHLCFDLRPGDHFTVRSYIQPVPSLPWDTGGTLFTPSRPSNLFPGLPLRFRALDYPFILCSVVNQRGADVLQTIVDVRTHTIQRLSDTFLAAMTSFSPPTTTPDVPEMPGCLDPDPSPPTQGLP